jgi:electron transfer flavoprotein beta subunit
MKALAMGADKGILLKNETIKDSFAIATILTEELKTHNYEIIFFGRQSVDYDNAITGQLTAGLLGYNCITVVVDLKIDNNKIIAEREIEGGREVVETEIPAVITVQKGLNEPRYASLKGIMTAKKKIIEEKPVLQTENLTEIVGMDMPSEKQSVRILGTDSSAVFELVRLLHDEAKII